MRSLCAVALAMILAILAGCCGSRASSTATMPASRSVTGYADVGDAKLFYEIAGNGPVVILIHAHTVDRRMWDPQFDALARHNRVLRYDLRGYGRSDMPQEGVSFHHANDLYKLMQSLKIGKAHLVGLSLGSFVAQDFLALHPEATLSATMASAGIRDSSPPPPPDQARAAKLRSIEQVKQRGLDWTRQRWLSSFRESAGPRWPKVGPPLTQMVDDWQCWQELHVEPEWRLTPPVQDRLAQLRINVPVQVIIASNDSQGSKNSSNELLRILPKARRTEIADAGHFSNMEQPEAFTAAIVSFINEVPSAP